MQLLQINQFLRAEVQGKEELPYVEDGPLVIPSQ